MLINFNVNRVRDYLQISSFYIILIISFFSDFFLIFFNNTQKINGILNFEKI